MNRRRDAVPERPPAPVFDRLPSPPGGGRRPEIPPPPAAKRSGGRTALVLAGLLAVGVTAGFVTAMLLECGPCHEAAFVSASFDYCVETPAGWLASPASEVEAGVDVFRKQDAATVVVVEAVTHDGGSLDAFADSIREGDSLAGYALGEIRSGSLAGSPALEWDVRVSSEDAEILVREIVVIRDGKAWRLRIADEEGAPPDGVEEATRLVDSLRFV
ncbi:MAG: hypothetical protein ACXWW5_03840 [Actinomycetota bacterium]